MDKAGGNKDFEQALAEAVFNNEEDDGQGKDPIKTDEIVDDAFTTEVCKAEPNQAPRG